MFSSKAQQQVIVNSMYVLVLTYANLCVLLRLMASIMVDVWALGSCHCDKLLKYGLLYVTVLI